MGPVPVDGLGSHVLVTKLNAAGTALAYFTFLGGTAGASSVRQAIAVDAASNAYVTGATGSTNFPVVNPAQATPGGQGDAFVAKFNVAGNALLYATYLGGSGQEGFRGGGTGIAVDAQGSAYVTGDTDSMNFPNPNAVQPTLGGGTSDAFVTKLSPNGSTFVYSTYLGGSGVELGNAIALDRAGNAYVAGTTVSTNFPTKNAFQPNNRGGIEAFVAQISDGSEAQAQIGLNPASLAFSAEVGRDSPPAKNLTLTNTGSGTLNWQAAATTTQGGNWLSVSPAAGALGANQSVTLTLAANTTGMASGTYAGGITVSSVNASNSPQTIPVTLSLSCPPASLSGLSAAPAQQCAPTDTLSIIAETPPRTEILEPGTTRNFSATVSIALQTKTRASLDVQLLDGPDPSRANVLALGGVEVRRDEGTTAKVVNLPQAVTIPADRGNLYLRAYLKDSELTIFKEAPLVTYTAGRNAVEIVAPKLDGKDAPPNSFLPTKPLEQSIAFECQLKHRLVNAPNGVLRVRAFSSTGGGPLAEAATVAVTDQPVTQAFKLSFQIPIDEPDIIISAELLNSALTQPLALAQLTYRNPSFELELGIQGVDVPFTKFNSLPVLAAGRSALEPLIPGLRFLAVSPKSELDLLPGVLPIITTVGLTNRSVTRSESFTCNQIDPTIRPTCVLLRLSFGKVPDDVDLYVFRMEATGADGSKLRSKPLSVLVDRVKIKRRFPPSRTTYTQGDELNFDDELEYNLNQPGSLVASISIVKLVRDIAGFSRYVVEERTLPLANFSAAAQGVHQARFPLIIPLGTVLLRVRYQLGSGKTALSEMRLFSQFNAPDVTLSANALDVANLLGVDVAPVQNQFNRRVRQARKAIAAITTLLGESKGSSEANLWALAQTQSLAQVPAQALPKGLQNFLGINAVWEFSPIPADGTFSADLTFHYTTEELPDDPNFNEAQVRIVSFDPATGRVESHPTTLDQANKTARVRVNGLAQFYTLGVFGPFAQRSMYFPVLRNLDDFTTRLTFASVGNSAASLTAQAYDATGKLYAASNVANPLTQALPAGRTLTSLASDLFKLPSFVDGGWLQTRVNKNFVAGYQMLGKDNRLDVLGTPAFYAGTQVLTDVAFDTTRTTEIHLANVTRFDNAVTLEWRSAAGTLMASYETTLAAKESWAARVQDLFTMVTQPFAGYVIVRGTHDLTAAALSVSANEIAALPGQVVLASNTATKLYAPYVLNKYAPFVVKELETVTRLNLVNPTTSAANLTLRLVNRNAVAQGAPVSLTLAAGQQLQREVKQLFNLGDNASFYLALIVESNITGITGDVSYRAPNSQYAFRAALPLTSETSSNFVFAHLDNREEAFTEVSVFNPQAQAASVTLKVFKADGSQTGMATFSVPAGGLYADLVDSIVKASLGQQGGYFTLSSNQPVLADAVFGTLSGTMLAALPAQAYDATAFTRANATVNAASYQGPQLAAESIVAAFGNAMAISVAVAPTVPLPLSLAGTSISVQDSAGVNRLAPLFFVSPGQINYLIPAGTALGAANVTITSGDGTNSTGALEIVKVASGLFTANANSLGVAAAVVFRVKADGAQSYETLSQFDATRNQFVATPIDLGPAGEQVFLLLFGTGARFNSGLANASCKIGGVDAPVLYVGAQGDLIGLDQANVAVPRSLIGRGEVDIVLTVDGKAANTVRVNIK